MKKLKKAYYAGLFCPLLITTLILCKVDFFISVALMLPFFILVLQAKFQKCNKCQNNLDNNYLTWSDYRNLMNENICPNCKQMFDCCDLS